MRKRDSKVVPRATARGTKENELQDPPEPSDDAATLSRAAAFHPRDEAHAEPTSGPGARTIIYSRAAGRQRWMESELARARAVTRPGRSVAHVIAALTTDAPPHPQVLVIDLDGLTAGELLDLHEIRTRGWKGTIVALGTVPMRLRHSLGIEKVLGAPFVEDALVDVLDKHRGESKAPRTCPLPVFPI